MTVDVHEQVLNEQGDSIAEPAGTAGWSTDEELRTHLLDETSVETTTTPEDEPAADVAETPAEATIEPPKPAQVETVTEQPSAEFQRMEKMFLASNATVERLTALLEKQAAEPEPAKEPEPDPWSRPSVDHLRESAKARLGDVSLQLLDQYTSQLSSLARWEGAAADTPDREHNITRIQSNMREIHMRAEYETKVSAMKTEFNTRLEALEKHPAQLQAATRVEASVRGKFTSDDLAGAGYANLAAAAKAGTLNVDTVLRGVDFGVLDLSDPTTYHVLDDRLALCDELLTGASSEPKTNPVAAPIKEAPAPAGGVRLANASSLTIPDRPGSTEEVKLRFWGDEEYDVEMRKHLTRTNTGMAN